MPRDKSANHEKIIQAAYDEFLSYGFQDASMRRIAGACNMSASGLYKHFPSKEEMFAALVDPVIEGFMDLYHTVEEEYFGKIDFVGTENAWQGQGEPVRTMQYIYDHIDEFRLIICKARGTKYESFPHDIAMLEEDATLRYIKELKKKGYTVKNVSRKEFHLLLTAYVEALFQAVAHDFTRKEAMHYAKTIETFYGNSWNELFGL
ncbi:MAG: TetR/AcrR family transcriptional regulator [Lachnospiraceae bacterium]|nr:TetR/AcrR family transcriptional regulator [Lachnospiraceae bacterium]